MNKQPLVSIIIPVYNGSNFMKEAIDSALSQTYPNVEIIVVNDGSKDNSEEIALSYGNRIRYYKKENGGVSSALNLGIREMKGEFFSWLSHDDKYTPEKIEHQVNSLLKHDDDRLIAYCNTIQINKDSQVIRKSSSNKYLKLNEINTWNESLIALIRSGCFSGCALLIPKIAFDEVGGFDESLRYSQDMLMWMRVLLKKFSILYCSGDHVLSRVHSGQLTQKSNEIFHNDSIVISNLVTDDLIKNSNKSNLIYYFALYNAKYNNKKVIKDIKKKKCLSKWQLIILFFTEKYGQIRPYIRKIYYHFRKI